MLRNHSLLKVLLALIILVSFLSIAGCGVYPSKGDAELLEDLTDEIILRRANGGPEWCACLDGIYPVDIYLDEHCKENLHYSLVWVWTVFLNDNLLEEIEHFTQKRDESEPAHSSQIPSYSWPHWDYINYQFKSEGTYTIRTDVYDIDEYGGMNILAPRRGTYTQTIHCRPLEGTITATSTGEPGEYNIICEVNNKDCMPDGNYTTGLQIVNDDTGVKECLIGDNSLNWAYEEFGLDHAVYQFQTEADYRLIYTLNYPDRGGAVLIEERLLSAIITEPEFSIELPPQPLKVGQEYTFLAAATGAPMVEPSYEWDFGDSNSKIIPFSNEATHLYEQVGTYTISVQIYEFEEADAPLIGEATAEVTVEEEEEDVDALSYLQQTTYLLVSVRGDTTYYIYDGRTGPRPGTVLNFYSNQPSTIWDGTHFSHRYSLLPTESDGGITVTIEGDVSEDANKIVNLTATVIYDDSHTNPGEQRESRISVINVGIEPESPIPATNDPSYEPHFVVYIEGPEVANYVTSTFFEHIQPTTSDPDFKIWYDPLEFVDTELIPFLRIEFGTSDLY